LVKILKHSKKEDTSIAERVYAELHQAIITGDIPSGTRLMESELASRKGASRTPVREALRMLSSEGLVYSIPRAGYIVEGLSEYEIRDLFAVRLAIEKLAAGWAVARMTPEELVELEESLLEMEKALTTRTESEIVESDRRFHDIIYRASGSKKLYEICKFIEQHTLKFRIRCLTVPEIGERAVKGHLEILRAMRSRDAGKVETATTSHLKVTQQNILECLAKDAQRLDVLR
jgi:DNA-binding GntR family transcriptional regulator